MQRLLLAAAIAIPAAAAPRAQERAARPPNIVFVLADDLGYRELGSFGQTRIHTPHLDGLAKSGMRLLRHYAGSPVCAPSRAVLMTGRHPGHCAIRDNKEAKPEGQWPLPAGGTLLPELLQERGYRCGAFGKWGLGMVATSGDPLARGFDRFYGYNCQRHAHSYWPAYLWNDAERQPLGNTPPVAGAGRLGADADARDAASYASFVGSDYAPDRIRDQALAFMRTHKDRPFFLYYPSPLPHLALQIPAADLAPYAGAFPETPYTGGNGYTPHPTPRAAYAAMITRLDHDVGALLAELDAHDLTANTIVVFTSDNGATHSPVGGTDVDFFGSCGELRGRKGSLFEGGIRVPAIVRWPGVVRADAECARITGFEDWLPTLAELSGSTAPVGLDGISFAATLRGEPQPERPFLYREFAGYGGWQAVWVGDEKLVRRQLQQADRATAELYDLGTDASEAEDLAGRRPERLRALQAIAAREHAPSAEFPLAGLGDR